jgi:hypothetical protein
MGTVERPMPNFQLWDGQEMTMTQSRNWLLCVIGLLSMVELFGCGQETPAEKAKAVAAPGSAATQAAGQAAVDAIKTPMDKARQTERILEQSAGQRAAQSKESTP